MIRFARPLPALALVAAALLAGCGEKAEPGLGTTSAGHHDALRVMLDYLPNADHAGLFAAKARGDYGRAGLDVTLQTPPDPAAPLKLLQAGRVDLAISYEPELLLARDKGATDLVAVAALVQKPLTSLMSIGKQPIRSASQLRGKRVGTAGIPYQSAYLKTILARAHVPESSVKETNVGASLLPAMLSGKVDATLGGFWNVEGVELEARGAKPWVEPVDKLGVPAYDELVLVANKDKLNGLRDNLRLFISALARGAQEARRDPGGATRALLAANRDLKRKETATSVKLTIPALFPTSGKPWGYLDPVAWRNYGGWMVSNGVLKRLPNIQSAIRNDLLPGAGLK
jgi:putative hydroxymethylpyrimidine transport system substrate-binding protein